MAERVILAVPSVRNLKKVQTRGFEYDFLHRVTDDFVGFNEDFIAQAIDTTNLFTTNGVGTEAPALVTNVACGEYNLVTSASSADSCSFYRANRSFCPSNNCVISVRLKLPSIANIKVEVGFTDSAASAVIGATAAGSVASLAATPTLNTGASDCACIIMDTASGLTNPTFWRLVTAKAGTTALATPTTTVAALKAPVAATYQTLTLALVRNELGATDDTTAIAYVNGIEVARIASAITNTANLNPYAIVVTNTTAAKTLTMDRFAAYQQREVTE